jgi:hypothetical protein
MLEKRAIFALVALAILLMSSVSAWACACCINPGYYEISTVKPTEYDLGTFGEMAFAPLGQLYESEAGFDQIRGLNDLRKDEEAGRSIDLTVEETFMGKVWRLNMKTAGGREGFLVLPMPKTMVKYKVDRHDNEPGTETSLYKEFRVKGTVASGKGFFSRDVVRPTSYFLVFQGRGNGCDSSADFTHWRLELSGPKAEYAFYGKLK